MPGTTALYTKKEVTAQIEKVLDKRQQGSKCSASASLNASDAVMAEVMQRSSGKLPAGGGTPLKKGAPARGASPARSASPAASKGKTRSDTPPKKGAAATPVKAGGAAAGKGKRPPAAPAPGTFEAAKKFDGPRPGFVFKNGPHGTGYYQDGKASSSSVRSAAADSTASSAREPEYDAAEVFALLPISMQIAFEARDIQALDAALAALPPAEAEVHMKRCVSSGLWDPNGGSTSEQEPSPTGDSDTAGPNSAASSPPGHSLSLIHI